MDERSRRKGPKGGDENGSMSERTRIFRCGLLRRAMRKSVNSTWVSTAGGGGEAFVCFEEPGIAVVRRGDDVGDDTVMS